MSKNSLDIVLPCYNPIIGWHINVLDSYAKICSSLKDTKVRIVLVNDGSLVNVSDTQIQYLKDNLSWFKYIKLQKNEGKGAALRKGFLQSDSDYVMFTDIDFPYLEDNIIIMFDELRTGSDIVIGTRNNQYYNKVPWFRKMISKFFKTIIKLTFQIPTSDTQAGLKAFSQRGKDVVLQTEIDRYLFDLELVKRANKQNLKFAFVNLDLKENIILSKMPVSILLSELKNLFRILFM